MLTYELTLYSPVIFFYPDCKADVPRTEAGAIVLVRAFLMAANCSARPGVGEGGTGEVLHWSHYLTHTVVGHAIGRKVPGTGFVTPIMVGAALWWLVEADHFVLEDRSRHNDEQL